MQVHRRKHDDRTYNFDCFALPNQHCFNFDLIVIAPLYRQTMQPASSSASLRRLVLVDGGALHNTGPFDHVAARAIGEPPRWRRRAARQLRHQNGGRVRTSRRPNRQDVCGKYVE